MNNITIDFIVNSCKGVKIGKGNPVINNVITDSRKEMNGNTLFVALKGENYDGHEFVESALAKGAKAAIISLDSNIRIDDNDKVLIAVENTLVALQQLAKSYRQKFNIPLVAVTGSVGKTTTKEILSRCLSSSLDTLYTEGNFNNDIGLPLTLLRLEDRHKAAVVEVAMRGLGEISRLVDIARPTCAIITNAEPVHLETLGSLKNIIQAKCEVLEYLNENDFAFINGDNELLVEKANCYHCKKYTFGYNEKCDCRILDVSASAEGITIEAVFFKNYKKLFFPVPSTSLAYNVVAAVGTALKIGISMEEIIERIESYETTGNRLKVTILPEGGKLIDDTYNANPISMAAALETSANLKEDKKLVAILGDMFELGEYEKDGHLSVGQKAYDNKVDMLVTIGHRALYIAKGAIDAGMDKSKVFQFLDKAECLSFLNHNVKKSDVVLFKASRGMQLETLIKSWLKE